MIETVRSFVLFCFFSHIHFFKELLDDSYRLQNVISIYWTYTPSWDDNYLHHIFYGSVQFTQCCPTLCDPMDCSTPGLPVHHQLPELTQTHVHRVGDGIQPSRPLFPFSSCLQSFPASESFLVSQFISGGQTIGVSASASVLPMNIQDWFPLGWTGWISLQSKGLSRVFSSTTVQKHQFFTTQLSLYFIFIFYGREWKMELRSIEEKRTKEHIENLNERGNLKFSVAEDIGMSF